MWSVTKFFKHLTLNEVNFNSHAHVERDQEEYDNFMGKCISTHTLMWSVTHATLIRI